MKKIFLTTAIFIAITNFCFSQEEEKQAENETIKPKSMIGGTTGLQFLNDVKAPYHRYSNPFVGIDLFYRHQLPILSDFYLTANVGYVGYATAGNFSICIKENDIPIALGFCYYKESIVNFYAGAELGVLYKNINYFANGRSIYNSYDIRGFLVGLTLGTWMPLSDAVNLEMNVKYKSVYYTDSWGINVGISFLIPPKNR